MSENNSVYDARAREQKAYEERMRMTSFKAKAVEFLVKAEGAGSHEMGQYFSSIAQTYATLELARINSLNTNRSNK